MKKALKTSGLKIQELLNRDQMKSLAGGYSGGCGSCGNNYGCYSGSPSAPSVCYCLTRVDSCH
jgi:hypothetical protein